MKINKITEQNYAKTMEKDLEMSHNRKLRVKC